MLVELAGQVLTQATHGVFIHAGRDIAGFTRVCQAPNLVQLLHEGHEAGGHPGLRIIVPDSVPVGPQGLDLHAALVDRALVTSLPLCHGCVCVCIDPGHSSGDLTKLPLDFQITTDCDEFHILMLH